MDLDATHSCSRAAEPNSGLMTAQVFINSLAAICGSRKCIYRVTFLYGVGTSVAARILKQEIQHPYKFALQTEHHGQQR